MAASDLNFLDLRFRVAPIRDQAASEAGVQGKGETARRRLAIRAWRRGTREMDLILGRYADAHLAGMDDVALGAFEALLDENDQDLLAWATAQAAAPPAHAALMAEIAAFARMRTFR
jgi:antitoxin CptB